MEHDERDRRNSDLPPPSPLEGGDNGPFSIPSSSEGDNGHFSTPPETGKPLIPGVEAAREKIAELKAKRRHTNWALQLKLRVHSSVVKRLVKEFDPDADYKPVDDRRALDVTGLVAHLVALDREILAAKEELRRAYRHRPKSAQELAWLAEGREKMRRMREAGQFEGRRPKPEFRRQRKSR